MATTATMPSGHVTWTTTTTITPRQGLEQQKQEAQKEEVQEEEVQVPPTPVGLETLRLEPWYVFISHSFFFTNNFFYIIRYTTCTGTTR